jgi:hypothetical protein
MKSSLMVPTAKPEDRYVRTVLTFLLRMILLAAPGDKFLVEIRQGKKDLNILIRRII